MKKLSTALLALATAFAIVPAAVATPLPIPVGTISEFEAPGVDVWGSGTADTLHPGVPPNSVGNGAFGAFGVLPVTNLNSEPATLIFNPVTGAAGDVFTFNGGLTFTITGSITLVLDTSQFLDIIGTGVFQEAGYLPTGGSFSFTDTDITGHSGTTGTSSAGETFVSSGVHRQFNTVPEPSSLVLLGTGLLGAAFLMSRRNRAVHSGSNV